MLVQLVMTDFLLFLLLHMLLFLIVIAIAHHIVHGDGVRVDHSTSNLGVIILEGDVRLYRFDEAGSSPASRRSSGSVIFSFDRSHGVGGVRGSLDGLLAFETFSGGLGLSSDVARSAKTGNVSSTPRTVSLTRNLLGVEGGLY